MKRSVIGLVSGSWDWTKKEIKTDDDVRLVIVDYIRCGKVAGARMTALPAVRNLEGEIVAFEEGFHKVFYVDVDVDGKTVKSLKLRSEREAIKAAKSLRVLFPKAQVFLKDRQVSNTFFHTRVNPHRYRDGIVNAAFIGLWERLDGEQEIEFESVSTLNRFLESSIQGNSVDCSRAALIEVPESRLMISGVKPIEVQDPDACSHFNKLKPKWLKEPKLYEAGQPRIKTEGDAWKASSLELCLK